MTRSPAEQAARNNALWCDAVCRAHGSAGEFTDTLWRHRHPSPPFYPNVVTLSEQTDVAAVAAARDSLRAAGLPDGWALKDSSASLDLAPLEFRPLFEAEWIWRTPSQDVPAADAGARWGTVRNQAELARWEAAWDGRPAGDAPSPSLFRPALLADADILFLSAERNGEIVAGAIADRTGDVVGLSNVFAHGDEAAALWAGLVAMIAERFPGLPIVGYERGPDLAVARSGLKQSGH